MSSATASVSYLTIPVVELRSSRFERIEGAKRVEAKVGLINWGI